MVEIIAEGRLREGNLYLFNFFKGGRLSLLIIGIIKRLRGYSSNYITKERWLFGKSWSLSEGTRRDDASNSDSHDRNVKVQGNLPL